MSVYDLLNNILYIKLIEQEKMNMAKRRVTQLALITLVTGCFFALSHTLFHYTTIAWNKAQLEDLAARNIVRTE